MSGVDVVQDLDGSYVILVGSGDREKPVMGFDDAYGVTNYFFKIMDQPTDADWLTDENGHLQRRHDLRRFAANHRRFRSGPRMTSWRIPRAGNCSSTSTSRS